MKWTTVDLKHITILGGCSPFIQTQQAVEIEMDRIQEPIHHGVCPTSNGFLIIPLRTSICRPSLEREV